MLIQIASVFQRFNLTVLAQAGERRSFHYFSTQKPTKVWFF